MGLTMGAALAMRQRRHALAPRAEEPVAQTVDRMIAVRGWPSRGAALSVAARQSVPASDSLNSALTAGDLIRAYAFRGGSYLFTPEAADQILAVRQITRVWETDRWQRQGAFAVESWEPLREAMETILSDGPKTRQEIAADLAAVPGMKHLAAAALGHGADSLYKPLHWWGDICFGPERAGVPTFRRRGTPGPLLSQEHIDAAGRALILRYLNAFGPASADNLRYWLTEGLGVPSRTITGWVDELSAEIVSIDIEGGPRCLLASDADGLVDAMPDETVRMLPAFDPWIIGPGTADPAIIAPDRRAVLSRGADFVIADGIVSGVWRKARHTLTVDWFGEAGPAPRSALGDEVQRLSDLFDEELTLVIR